MIDFVMGSASEVHFGDGLEGEADGQSFVKFDHVILINIDS